MRNIYFYKFLLIVCANFIVLTVFSQDHKTIKGTVYSESSNTPISGVTILLKSNSRQFSTDEFGEYIITNINNNETLVFSYLGYETQEIFVSELSEITLDVYLKNVIDDIEEVIVNTGYQKLPKERVTGSFSVVDNELFNRNPSGDLISRLEGVTNGLLFEMPSSNDAPSSNPNLRVRGLSTIHGESRPLIVLDNFPYEGDIKNINPNDVESVTILKDAAAASIWGARAGNGVIVITTKKGMLDSAPVINFNTNRTITNKPDLYYNQSQLPPNEYIELEKIMFQRGLYKKNDWTALTPAVELLFEKEDGLIDESTANLRLEELKKYDIRNEASSYLYRKGISQQFSLNVMGGTKKHQYYISAGYNNNSRSSYGDDDRKLTLNAKNSFELIDNLTINSSVTYVKNNANSNGITYFSLNPSGHSNIYSYARLLNEEGTSLPIIKYNRLVYTDKALDLGLLDWHYRPIDELSINDNQSSSDEIKVNTSVNYQFFKAFNAEVLYQYQNYGSRVNNHFSEESYTARNLINSYTQLDGTRPIPLGGILDKSSSLYEAHYGRFQLSYNTNFNKLHEVNVLGGYEVRQEFDKSFGQSRLYGYDDDILTYSTNLNFDDNFLLRPNLSGRIPYGSSSGSEVIDRFVSYYANLSYIYNNKYSLTASTRWDASNIFGVSFNQKGVPLWSTGASWTLSNEPFFNLDWVSYAKLRMTYGANGNVVRSVSALPVLTYFGIFNITTGLPAGTISSVGNPDLKWEKVNIINLGLDYSLLGGRLSGSIEWYRKNSVDLIGEDLLDPTTGVFYTGVVYNIENRRNYASLKTSGVDVELKSVNLKERFRWETSVLFNYSQNKITDYYTRQNARAIDFLQGTPPVVEGVSKESLYAIPWYNLDETGSPLVLVEGELSRDYDAYFNDLEYEDLINVGSYIPPFFGSLRNTFNWSSFSIDFNLVWKFGHKYRRKSINYNDLFGSSHVMHSDYIKRWQSPGDELTTNVPSMPEVGSLRRDQAYVFSEALIESGNHIRLQDVNFSYRLPDKYCKAIGLRQVDVFTYLRNFGILWKESKNQLDPDVQSLFPSPFQFTFGLQIKL